VGCTVGCAVGWTVGIGRGVAVGEAVAVGVDDAGLGGTTVTDGDGPVVGTTNGVGPVVAMTTSVGVAVGSADAPEPVSAGPEAQAETSSRDTTDMASTAADFGAVTSFTRFVLRRRT
jgi:hypothetical protein